MLGAIGSTLKHALGTIDDLNTWRTLRNAGKGIYKRYNIERAVTVALMDKAGVKGNVRVLRNLTDAERQFVTGATDKLRQHIETVGGKSRLSKEGMRMLTEDILPTAPGAMAPDAFGRTMQEFFTGVGAEGGVLARAPRWGRAAFRGSMFAGAGLTGLWAARGPFNMLKPGNQPGPF